MKKSNLFLFQIIILGLILGMTVMLNGCTKKQNNTTEPPNSSKTEISVVELGDLRIQLLSDTIVRIENKGPKGFEDRPSYIVLNRDDYDKIAYTIEKATHNMSGISFNNVTVTYNGQEHAITISGTLPSGVTVNYSDNAKTNAGTYNAVATFEYDTDNYNIFNNMVHFNRSSHKLLLSSIFNSM